MQVKASRPWPTLNLPIVFFARLIDKQYHPSPVDGLVSCQKFHFRSCLLRRRISAPQARRHGPLSVEILLCSLKAVLLFLVLGPTFRCLWDRMVCLPVLIVRFIAKLFQELSGNEQAVGTSECAFLFSIYFSRFWTGIDF